MTPSSGTPPAAGVAARAAVLWGADAARPARAEDAVDTQAPEVVLQPDSTAMLTAMLRWADEDGVRLVIRGAGTRRAWGNAGAPCDGVLSLARMDATIDHYAGDLTATVPAGMSLGAANAILRRNRQWIPLDPPFEHATIGGLVATNESGPRRHGYGTLRDVIIGAEIALADGRLAKGGGRVVKNVAGYDLPRLMCGSFGALGVIVHATFKLAPVAESSVTVIAAVADPARLGILAGALAASPLTPSAIELQVPGPRLLIRFETVSAAVDQQAAQAMDLCRQHADVVSSVRGAEEDAVWDEHRAAAADGGGTVVRIGVLPTDCGRALTVIDALVRGGGITAAVQGRAALGALQARLSGSFDARVTAVSTLRRELGVRRGHVVVVDAEPEFRAAVDPWGPRPDGVQVMQALKQRFDPRGTLNAGRGPAGL